MPRLSFSRRGTTATVAEPQLRVVYEHHRHYPGNTLRAVVQIELANPLQVSGLDVHICGTETTYLGSVFGARVNPEVRNTTYYSQYVVLLGQLRRSVAECVQKSVQCGTLLSQQQQQQQQQYADADGDTASTQRDDSSTLLTTSNVNVSANGQPRRTSRQTPTTAMMTMLPPPSSTSRASDALVGDMTRHGSLYSTLDRSSFATSATTAAGAGAAGAAGAAVGDAAMLTVASGATWQHLYPGVYSFPLAVQLPIQLPPSYSHSESRYTASKLRYTATATLTLSVGRKLTCQTQFVVLPLPVQLQRWLLLHKSSDNATAAAAAAAEAATGGGGGSEYAHSEAATVERGGGHTTTTPTRTTSAATLFVRHARTSAFADTDMLTARADDELQQQQQQFDTVSMATTTATTTAATTPTATGSSKSKADKNATAAAPPWWQAEYTTREHIGPSASTVARRLIDHTRQFAPAQLADDMRRVVRQQQQQQQRRHRQQQQQRVQTGDSAASQSPDVPSLASRSGRFAHSHSVVNNNNNTYSDDDDEHTVVLSPTPPSSILMLPSRVQQLCRQLSFAMPYEHRGEDGSGSNEDAEGGDGGSDDDDGGHESDGSDVDAASGYKSKTAAAAAARARARAAQGTATAATATAFSSTPRHLQHQQQQATQRQSWMAVAELDDATSSSTTAQVSRHAQLSTSYSLTEDRYSRECADSDSRHGAGGRGEGSVVTAAAAAADTTTTVANAVQQQHQQQHRGYDTSCTYSFAFALRTAFVRKGVVRVHVGLSDRLLVRGHASLRVALVLDNREGTQTIQRVRVLLQSRWQLRSKAELLTHSVNLAEAELPLRIERGALLRRDDVCALRVPRTAPLTLCTDGYHAATFLRVEAVIAGPLRSSVTRAVEVEVLVVCGVDTANASRRLLHWSSHYTGAGLPHGTVSGAVVDERARSARLRVLEHTVASVTAASSMTRATRLSVSGALLRSTTTTAAAAAAASSRDNNNNAHNGSSGVEPMRPTTSATAAVSLFDTATFLPLDETWGSGPRHADPFGVVVNPLCRSFASAAVAATGGGGGGGANGRSASLTPPPPPAAAAAATPHLLHEGDDAVQQRKQQQQQHRQSRRSGSSVIVTSMTDRYNAELLE